MTSVRLSPLRSSTPAQGHGAAPRAATPVVKKAVDGFERKSVSVAPVLQRGMTGSSVTSLQHKLVAARFMPLGDFKSGPGVYGPRTEAAVKRLQEFVGLPVTGVAGPSTMAALNSGARFVPAADVEKTVPIAKKHVLAKLSETFTDEVTQPIAVPHR